MGSDWLDSCIDELIDQKNLRKENDEGGPWPVFNSRNQCENIPSASLDLGDPTIQFRYSEGSHVGHTPGGIRSKQLPKIPTLLISFSLIRARSKILPIPFLFALQEPRKLAVMRQS